MGILERKERKRSELREQILAAARTIVFRDGIEALTMRKIADAIEYSPATIYLHFENREAIALALCREASAVLFAQVGETAAIADPAERLHRFGCTYVRYGIEHPQEYKLVFMTDSALMESVFDEAMTPDDPASQAFDYLTAAVAEAQTQGAIRSIDPRIVAEALWCAVHGIVSLALTCSDALTGDPLEIAEVQVGALVRGFA
jgi:AcrR family transcriptional regulator